MGDAVLESGPTADRRSPPVRRKPLPVAKASVAALAAVALIGFTGHQLRSRQNLVGSIAAKDVQVFIPMYNDLQERVDARANWNRLYARLDQFRDNDPRQFVSTGFELEKLITTKVSPDDPRRMQVLLDIAVRTDAVSDASNAYWELFNPAWRSQLQPNYAKYAEVLQKQNSDSSSSSLGHLDHLSQVLESLGETKLDVQTLKQIRGQSTINFVTIEPMKRLVQQLPASDPDRAPLQKQIDDYARFREQLVAFGGWFEKFEAARLKGDLAAAEKLRSQAPPGPPNAFLASADAHLAQLKTRLGQYDEGNRLRQIVSQYHLTDADFDECASIVQDMAPNDARAGKRIRTTAMAGPDLTTVRIQQWRGAMLSGHPADAPNLKALYPAKEFGVVHQYMDDEAALLAGQTAKLKPLATFERRDSGLPAELGSSPHAWTVALELTPIGKSIEKQPKPHVELWMDDQHLLVIFNSPYPRDSAAKPTRQRDAVFSGDNHIDMLFNPDRWIDTYTYVAVNEADTVYDARVTNADLAPRRRYVADTKLNLDPAVSSTAAPDHWQQRILLPRALLFPPGSTAIRFNIRQIRQVTERGQRLAQTYSWHPGAGGASDFRTDQSGFLLLPKQ